MRGHSPGERRSGQPQKVPLRGEEVLWVLRASNGSMRPRQERVSETPGNETPLRGGCGLELREAKSFLLPL